MAVEYVKGNIIELFNNGEYEILIHGCNCFHTMGRGLALALRQRWPEVYEADQTSVCGDYDKLGKYTIATLSDSREVYNLYSQYRYGRKDVQISYAAIEEGLKSIAAQLKENDDEDKRIIMPLIGATNGGADPIFIKQVILSIFGDLNVTVVTDEIKESRDKIHLIQSIPTHKGDIRAGLELFVKHDILEIWIERIRHRAAIISTISDLEGVLSSLVGKGIPIIAVGKITMFDKHEAITQTIGIEHALMLARDYCVANDKDAIYIISADNSIYADALDYCDVVHHIKLTPSDRDNPSMDQWYGYSDWADTDRWINQLYRKISTSYGAVSGHPDSEFRNRKNPEYFGDDGRDSFVIHIADTVYRRIDKNYREQYAI